MYKGQEEIYTLIKWLNKADYLINVVFVHITIHNHIQILYKLTTITQTIKLLTTIYKCREIH